MSSIASEILDMKASILRKYSEYFTNKAIGASRSIYMQNEYLIAMDIYIMQCEYYEEAQGESTVDIDLWDVYGTIEQFNRYFNLMRKGYYD